MERNTIQQLPLWCVRKISTRMGTGNQIIGMDKYQYLYYNVIVNRMRGNKMVERASIYKKTSVLYFQSAAEIDMILNYIFNVPCCPEYWDKYKALLVDCRE